MDLLINIYDIISVGITVEISLKLSSTRSAISPEVKKAAALFTCPSLLFAMHSLKLLATMLYFYGTFYID